MEEGADSTAMLSPERVAVLFRNDAEVSYEGIAWEFFPGADFVLVEGGRDDHKTRKIEVLRKGISGKVTCPLNELVAVVSDEKIEINRPVFHPQETGKIADLLEKEYENEQ
jgi:molybdopterin-guanine dinucleotide biosynthesis protein B